MLIWVGVDYFLAAANAVANEDTKNASAFFCGAMHDTRFAHTRDFSRCSQRTPYTALYGRASRARQLSAAQCSLAMPSLSA